MRATLLHGALLGIAAAAMCLVPLFNLLGYESSLLLSLLSSVAAMHLGVVAVVSARHGLSPSGAEAADMYPGWAVFSCFGRAFGTTLLLLLLPLGLLLLNGLRVRNCDYLAGASFFLMMPVASAGCGAALGTVTGLLTKKGWAVLLGLLAILFSVLFAGWRFLSSPAIFAYDPFFGYFPGALYDEELAIGLPFYAARMYHALWAVAALTLCAFRLDGRALRARPFGGASRRAAGRSVAWPRRPLLAALCLVTLSAAVTFSTASGALGIQRDVPALLRVLSAETRTRHFALRYAPGGAIAKEIDLLAKEHELRYEQLHELLQVTPNWEPGVLSRLLRVEVIAGTDSGTGPLVISYLFESARQKQELMGASHTYIAKPWRREIYLQRETWPHPILKHELAHVFAGAAGDPVLRVSLRGIIPDQGMIEGLAEAADWPVTRLTLHQAVKAMREAHLEPPLLQVLGFSFLALSSGRAYTVAGSFCRYLLDLQGPAKLLQVYREGGTAASFARAYGRPLPELAAEWGRFIDQQQVAPAEREVERERVRRPPVFHKVCAHELALRRQQAADALSHGDVARARHLLLTICQDDPSEPRHLNDLMDVLWSAGLRSDAAQAARDLLADPFADGVPVLRARAQALLGDFAWLSRDPAAARTAYQRASALPTDESMARLLTAKLLALSEVDHPVAGPLILRVLVGAPEPDANARDAAAAVSRDRDSALDLYTLGQAIAAEPELGLSHYLLGRQLFSHGGYLAAAAELRRSLDLSLPDRRFMVQAGRLLGQSLLLAGDPAAAAAAFSRLRDSLLPAPTGRSTKAAQAAQSDEAQRVDLGDWIDRAQRWRSL